MKILLVTATETLEFNLLKALNPENDYCAIVVNEVVPAKKFAAKIGLPENLIHPLDELKNCIDEIYYDILVCISENFTDYNELAHYVKKRGCPPK